MPKSQEQLGSESPGLSTPGDYFRVIGRRKWIVLLALVIVPLTAVLLSARQEALYEARADVLLNPQNLAATLGGTSSGTVFQDPERIANTQAELASVPEVAERALEAAGVTGISTNEFLGSSSVSAKPNADLLEFRVENGDPDLAVDLANEYALQFIDYRLEVDTRAIARALEKVTPRIRSLERRGDRQSAVYQNLKAEEDQLLTAEAIATANTSFAREAQEAVQIQPRTVRNGVLGVVLGLGLGLLLAFLRDSLDTRVRSVEEIAERLRLPLLGRVPRPPRWVQRSDELVMLTEPESVEAESFRMLRTNLEFVNLDRNAQVIMVTSAVEQEGKSTTAANLAVALARGGKHTVLVDLDLRHPFIRRFFRIEEQVGLTDVVLGHASLDDAIVKMPIDPAHEVGRLNAATNGGQAEGLFEVLQSGPIPPNAGEFVGTKALAAVIEELRERADIVLIDAPPVLRVGDAMALSPVLDGILVVVRFKVARRSTLNELARALDASPVSKLGFVLTDTELGEGYGESYYHYYEPKRPEAKRRPRDRRRAGAVDSEQVR